MTAILYYILLKPLSLLPWRVLYFFSDLTYLIVAYVFPYRKKVVRQNLKNSFPNKSSEELKDIERKFYQHFCDFIIESLKSFSSREDDVKRRLVCKNPEVVNQFYDQGLEVVITGGHYNNWEMYAIGCPLYHKHQLIGIYKPLSNKFFNSKFKSTREKYGLEMIPIKAFKSLLAKQAFKHRAHIFAVDQSPSKMSGHWVNFLNQDTLTAMGAEKYAREYNLPVVAGKLYKVKRGHYEVEYQVITEQPRSEKPGKIIEDASRCIEEQILEKPEYWLWTHRRWKKKKPNKNGQPDAIGRKNEATILS